MSRVNAVAALATLMCASRVAAQDSCDIGSYFSTSANACKYCMNAPLGAVYTGNGNRSPTCPYEMCEACGAGEYRAGCGYDDQTSDPASVCFAMTDVADICSAGPQYCTVQPQNWGDYSDCSDYCTTNVLGCMGSYTSSGTCPSDITSLTLGSCSAAMTSKTLCACELTSTQCTDKHKTGILTCSYYAGTTANYCPSTTTTATLANQIWAAQNCRSSCGLCTTGASWNAGECADCTDIASGTVGKYYSSDGDRSDSCDVSTCTQECFLGEYNAGCGYNNFQKDTVGCGLCKASCGTGKYLSSVCSGTGYSDSTVCSSCKTSCSLGFYVSGTCDGTSATDTKECVACTASCSPGYYISGTLCTGTGTSNTASCKACTTTCPSGQFPSGSCSGSGTSDGVSCKSCSTSCTKTTTTTSCFATCFSTTVLGGSSNLALNSYDVVGGGLSNQAGFLTSDSTGIGTSDQYNVVVGGSINTVGGSYSSLTGGYDNFAFGLANVVGGGYVNTVSSGSKNAWSKTMKYAVIGGGKSNKVTADYGVVVGGELNQATAEASGALGGKSNTASGTYSVVLGGETNSVKTSWAAVGGGKENKAWANYAAAPGGYLAKASARFSVALGGSRNTAKGRYSLAAGFKATARVDYSGVLGFNGVDCKDNGIGSFNICADYFYVNGYDITALLASARGRRSRRLADGSEVHTGNDAEMRRLVRDMGYTLEASELEHELDENDVMLKTIDAKVEAAAASLQQLDRMLQPSSLRSR